MKILANNVRKSPDRPPCSNAGPPGSLDCPLVAFEPRPLQHHVALRRSRVLEGLNPGRAKN